MKSSAHCDNLLATIDRLSGATVGVVGDLVADLYVSGLTQRVSREAPVLIVQYEQDWLRPGGAANVAANISALGASACLIGLVGQDEPGQRLIAGIAKHKPVVVDSRYNLHCFTGMTVVKPNEEEAAATAGRLGLRAGGGAELAAPLREALRANAALVTLGNQGMALAQMDGVV